MKRILLLISFLTLASCAFAEMPEGTGCSLPDVVSAWNRPASSLPVRMERDREVAAGEAGHPYRVRLAPCSGSHCKADTHAGMVAIDIRRTGRYRIAVDEPVWIDVLTDTGMAEGVMCEHTGCRPLRKIVQFNLEAGRHWINLIASHALEVGLLVVPVSE